MAASVIGGWLANIVHCPSSMAVCPAPLLIMIPGKARETSRCTAANIHVAPDKLIAPVNRYTYARPATGDPDLCGILGIHVDRGLIP